MQKLSQIVISFTAKTTANGHHRGHFGRVCVVHERSNSAEIMVDVVGVIGGTSFSVQGLVIWRADSGRTTSGGGVRRRGLVRYFWMRAMVWVRKRDKCWETDDVDGSNCVHSSTE